MQGVKKRKQVKRACGNCQRAHASCSSDRPCTRCIETGQQDTCGDVPRKRDIKTTNTESPGGIIRVGRRSRQKAGTATADTSNSSNSNSNSSSSGSTQDSAAGSSAMRPSAAISTDGMGEEEQQHPSAASSTMATAVTTKRRRKNTAGMTIPVPVRQSDGLDDDSTDPGAFSWPGTANSAMRNMSTSVPDRNRPIINYRDSYRRSTPNSEDDDDDEDGDDDDDNDDSEYAYSLEHSMNEDSGDQAMASSGDSNHAIPHLSPSLMQSVIRITTDCPSPSSASSNMDSISPSLVADAIHNSVAYAAAAAATVKTELPGMHFKTEASVLDSFPTPVGSTHSQALFDMHGVDSTSLLLQSDHDHNRFDFSLLDNFGESEVPQARIPSRVSSPATLSFDNNPSHQHVSPLYASAMEQREHMSQVMPSVSALFFSDEQELSSRLRRALPSLSSTNEHVPPIQAMGVPFPPTRHAAMHPHVASHPTGDIGGTQDASAASSSHASAAHIIAPVATSVASDGISLPTDASTLISEFSRLMQETEQHKNMISMLREENNKLRQIVMSDMIKPLEAGAFDNDVGVDVLNYSFHQSSIPMALSGLSTDRLLAANTAFCKLFSIPVDKWRDYTWRMIIHPDHFNMVTNQWLVNIASQNYSYNQEIKCIHVLTNQVMLVMSRVDIIRDDSGKPLMCNTTVLQISLLDEYFTTAQALAINSNSTVEKLAASFFNKGGSLSGSSSSSSSSNSSSTNTGGTSSSSQESQSQQRPTSHMPPADTLQDKSFPRHSSTGSFVELLGRGDDCLHPRPHQRQSQQPLPDNVVSEMTSFNRFQNPAQGCLSPDLLVSMQLANNNNNNDNDNSENLVSSLSYMLPKRYITEAYTKPCAQRQ